MINDADIKKMKAVFATKKDLKAFTTKEDLKSFATKEDLKDLSKKIDTLSNSLQKNSEELVELITLGFESNEKRFERIEAEVFKSN